MLKQFLTLNRVCWAVACLTWSTLGLAANASEQCIEAHESGLKLRSRGRLLEAASALNRCAAQSCPRMIRKECASLAEAVRQEIPSLGLNVTDASGDVVIPRKVEVDGEHMSDAIDRALQLDPGEHSLRIELKDGRVLLRKVQLKAGEGTMRLELVFPAKPKRASPRPRKIVPRAATQSRTSPWFWLSMGAGVAALSSFAYFANEGRTKEQELQQSCAPRCSQADADSMRRSYLIADLSLLGAAGAFGTAGYLYFTASPTATSKEDRGAMVRVGGRF